MKCDCYGCWFAGQGACGCMHCDGCGFESMTMLECVDDERNCHLCAECIAEEKAERAA